MDEEVKVATDEDEDEEKVVDYAMRKKAEYIKDRHHHKNRVETSQKVVVKIKIVFVFFQVVMLFQDVYIFQYPQVYVGFFQIFSIFQINIFALAKMECFIESGFLNHLIFTTVLPLAIILSFALIYLLSYIYSKKNDAYHSYISNSLSNFFILITYTLFPSLCATIFSSFVCEDFDNGDSLLRADYSVNCDSSEYTYIYSLAIIMIFIYPIGIPLSYLFILWTYKDQLNPVVKLDDDVYNSSGTTNVKLGYAIWVRDENVSHLRFLYDPYLPQYWWFEVIECIRKLSLTGFIVFFYEGSILQVAMSLILSVIAGFMYAYLQVFFLILVISIIIPIFLIALSDVFQQFVCSHSQFLYILHLGIHSLIEVSRILR